MKHKGLFACLLSTALILFFPACKAVPLGGLTVQIEGKTMIKSGERVKFTVVPPEKTALENMRILLLDEDGQTIEVYKFDKKDFEKTLIYEYPFYIGGKYHLEAYCESADNYGYSRKDLTVQYSGPTLNWHLADDPANEANLAIKSTDPSTGEYPKTVFDLTQLADNPSVKSVDVKLIQTSDAGEEVLFYQKSIKNGTFDWKPEAGKFGTVKIQVFLNMHDGNRMVAEDQFSLLDPSNPVAITVSASQSDPEYPDKIRVRGIALYDGNPVASLKLIRRCSYGKESGCEPLLQPHCNPDDKGKFYSKAGVPFPVHETEYPLTFLPAEGEGETPSGDPQPDPDCLLKYDPESGIFEFIDPMPYFNENGDAESEGFTWNYAKIDREAWKAILRKKNFDLARAFGVSYIIEAVGEEGKEPVRSVAAVGIPYLSKVPMASLCLWAKETVVNRLWHMQVPRYCYSKSQAWLQKGQNIKSTYGDGRVSYSASISGGDGKIDASYADWPDIQLYTTRNIGVAGIKLETNVRRTHEVFYNLITPLWGTTEVHLELHVRDYTLQWGLWENSDKPQNCRMEITRDGKKETLNYQELLKIMPKYNSGGWNPQPGYGYEPWDVKSTDPKALEDQTKNPTWTRVNFKYRPSIDGAGGVENGEWSKHEDNWEVHYDVTE